VHIEASDTQNVDLEQAFLRYNFNQDFSLTAGRQLTVLGFEKDESPNMYQTSYAYLTDVSSDVANGDVALEKFVGVDKLRGVSKKVATNNIIGTVATLTAATEYEHTNAYLNSVGITTVGTTVYNGGVGNPADIGDFNLPQFRRNYVDGVRLNFNNGQFGFVAGLHNGYFTNDENLNDGNIALDIAASVMIIPGLELRLGFGYENNDDYNNAVSGYNKWASGLRDALSRDVSVNANIADSGHIKYDLYRNVSQLLPFPESDDISQLNFLLSYQTGGLTLAFEWDLWNVYVIDMWNLMFLANYQFNDVFGLTFRYSHEDFEADVPGGGEGSSNRFTIGPMFSVTDNLTVGIEYSHAELDSDNTGDTSVDELYAETIFSF
jgi:hypothetical protein